MTLVHRNALSRQLRGEPAAHLDAAVADARGRAIVLTHIGPVFCAGAGLTEAAGEESVRAGLQLFRSLVEAPRAVVAVVHGAVRDVLREFDERGEGGRALLERRPPRGAA